MDAPANTFGWLGEFRDRQTESDFRNASLATTRRFNVGGSLVVLLATVILAINDYTEAGAVTGVIAARNAQSLLALACCYVSFRFDRWQWVYGGSYLLALAIVMGAAWIDYTRPADYLLHLGLDVVIIFAIYAAVPGIRWQLGFAVAYSVVLMWLHVSLKLPAYDMANITVPVSLLLANGIALATSVSHGLTRRELWSATRATST